MWKWARFGFMGGPYEERNDYDNYYGNEFWCEHWKTLRMLVLRGSGYAVFVVFLCLVVLHLHNPWVEHSAFVSYSRFLSFLLLGLDAGTGMWYLELQKGLLVLVSFQHW
jgi:hypothetical protein